jgi:hypothetical protein
MAKRQEYRGRDKKRVVIDTPILPVHTCTCGKLAYTSKKDAKQGARTRHQGKRVRYYVCRESEETYWHVTTAGALATEAYKDYEAERKDSDGR